MQPILGVHGQSGSEPNPGFAISIESSMGVPEQASVSLNTNYPSFPLRKPQPTTTTQQGGCCGGSNNQTPPSGVPGMHYCACKNQYQPNADCEFQQFLHRYVTPQTATSISTSTTSPVSSALHSGNQSSDEDMGNVPKANTSCLLCKIRHRKCDYTYPVCNHCAKESRSFCLYISNVKRGPKKQAKEDDASMVDECDNPLMESKENIDSVYRNIYTNISNIRSDPDVISRLSFGLLKKIVDKILPNSERDEIHQLCKMALQPQNEPFVGEMDFYYKYFYKIGEKEIALVSVLQAICLQRLNEKSMGSRMFEKARSKISVIFDHVSDFKLIAIYIFCAMYLLGEGEKQRAEYFLNHVKFYVKEFQPNMQEAQFLLRTVLLSESVLQESNEQILKHYENILLFFTPLEDNPNQNQPSQSALDSISSYVVTSNERIFKAGSCKYGETEPNVELHKQLNHLKVLMEKNTQNFPMEYEHLLSNLLNSKESMKYLSMISESSPKQSESMELKIKQINSAIENIRSKYGTWDFLGNTFIMMLYCIIILTQQKSFNDDISVDAMKCADMISKCTEYDDFSLSSFPAGIPLSIACRIHLQSLKTVLNSTSLIITEYAEQLTQYLQLDFDALEMLIKKFPLLDRRFSNLLKDANLALRRYAEAKRLQPEKFVSLNTISQQLSMFKTIN